MGPLSQAPWNTYFGSAAIESTTVMPVPTTRPNTVNPPFWPSRLDELSARLKNHSRVALLIVSGVGGCPVGGPTFAYARVPRVFEIPNSFSTGACDVTCGKFIGSTCVEPSYFHPPP